ncbi:MAG TPA: hypothetical protein DEP23_11130 [Ruminococcaceae bacterium]|nr:hypothetical protein [Oscillospiraceae bacterium]
MALLYSKVALLANDCMSTVEFLVCGIPREADDLAGYTAYEDFVEEHSDSECFDVTAEAYVYGNGETEIANIYEIAAFTQRGDDFLKHPEVQLIEKVNFEIYNGQNNMEMEL